MLTRRQFVIGAGTLAFAGLSNSVLGKVGGKLIAKTAPGYGPLIPDADKILDLPKGFSYRIISQLGDKMSDGMHVPDRADGMGCLPLPNNKVALIRNHELHPKHLDKQPDTIQAHKTLKTYDTYKSGVALPGGTSTIVYDMTTHTVDKEFLSLVGTIRNCAGGVTPWGSWLTCEESVDKPDGDISKEHGYIFEIPATATTLVDPKPLKAMGRFNHEAAAVDPKTGIVYLTEDRGDSLFYRFVPKVYGELDKGGQLQALVIKAKQGFDSRNWNNQEMPLNAWFDAVWIDLDNPESPEDDLRLRGFEKGAALFARGEGIHWGDNELYFCCTNGGRKQLGQIMRYQPQGDGVEAGRIQLFLESVDESLYNFGDNLTVTPQNHLLVCEDQYTDVVSNHLRGVTPDGKLYDFAKLHVQTEPAGACFSPDGSTLFVNLYSPTKTLAITGPWEKINA
ncbi:alkaline phosphatase PhoX [Thalassotalea euphylliae]|uniref:alkaline phosphatase PhoX n=1 Tax=Thalassotalea euphylliae TaxID=1655234 RepID=UPI00362C8D61